MSQLIYKTGSQCSSRLAIFICIFLMLFAFIPLLSPGGTLSTELNDDRAAELILLSTGLGLAGIFLLIKYRGKIYVKDASVLVTFLFIYWAICSGFWSPMPSLTLGRSVELLFVLIGAIFVVSIARHASLDSSDLAGILAMVFALAFLLLLIANLFIWKTPFPFVSNNGNPTEILDMDQWARRPRMILGYAYPLAVANFSSLAIIALLASRLNKSAKSAFFLFFMGLLIFADGRGALVAALVVILIHALLKIRNRLLRTGVVTICVASLIAALIASSFFSTDSLNLRRDVLWSDVDSLNGRTAVWSYAIDLALTHHPFIGYGYYSSRYELIQAFWWAGHAHNSFVEIFLTTGLIGLSLLILYTIYLLFVAVKTKDLFLIGLSIYSLIAGFLNPLFFTPGFSMLILQISLMQANRQRRRVIEVNDQAIPRRTRMTESAAFHLPTSSEI